MKELLELGETPDEIATKLIQLECKGEIGNSDRCPLANYIKNKVKNVYLVNVGQTKLEVFIRRPVKLLDSFYPQFCTHFTIYFGKIFEEFIKNFDSGLYPKLIRNL